MRIPIMCEWYKQNTCDCFCDGKDTHCPNYCGAGLKWEELTEGEKEQAIESYMFFRTEEEEKPSSRERAEEEVVCCGFERQDTGYIYVDL